MDATTTIERDSLLLTMMPHTHLRGKTFKYHVERGIAERGPGEAINFAVNIRKRAK